MKDFLVVANLKSNLLAKDLVLYLNTINEYKEKRLVICPTSIYVPYFLKHDYQVGLQNIFYDEGKCTGEITAKQAASVGISYVIIGHSDRRKNFNETDGDINKKVKQCLDSGLKVILCVGESIEEKQMMKTSRVLKRQLMSDLRGINNLDNVYIAYEPIWAIGTNKMPSNQDIKEVAKYIKEIVLETNNYQDVNIIYGGSVDDNNIELIKKIPNICGVLVGNSSLDAKKLLKIVES